MNEEQWSGWPEFLEAYRNALDRLREWDIRVPPGCRLLEYERRIGKLTDAPLPQATLAEADQAMFDFREADELIEIVDSFPRGPGSTARERLQDLIGGTSHPDDEGHSPARDTQYEMYLRAMLWKGGITAAFGNPDLLPRVEGRRVPIEAKRPKKLENIDGCLRKGVRQVEGTGASGLISLSLDLAVRPEHEYMIAGSREAVEQGADLVLRRAVLSQIDSIADRVRERDVIAVLFTMRLPARVRGTHHSWLVSRYHFEALPASLEDQAIARAIYEAIERGGS